MDCVYVCGLSNESKDLACETINEMDWGNLILSKWWILCMHRSVGMQETVVSTQKTDSVDILGPLIQ